MSLDTKATFDEMLSRLLQTKLSKQQIPGVVFHAASRDGTTIVSRAVGKRSIIDNSDTMTEDTVFWTASCTKVMTSLCAMKCVDQGLITLDEDAIPYLPDLAKQKVRKGWSNLVPLQSKVTLRHLLSMTSGLSYPLIDHIMPILSSGSVPTGKEPYQFNDETNYIGPFDCEPGTTWSYSCGVDWAGILVEKLSGLKLGDYATKHILEPCGVSASELTWQPTEAQYSKLAGAHYRYGNGKLSARGEIYKRDMKHHIGGTGMFCTARALSETLLLLINEGKHPKTGNQVLSSSTIKEMLRPQLSASQQRSLVGYCHCCSPRTSQWGLGFVVLPEGSGPRGAGTATWTGFCNTNWMADPTSGIVMTFFTQIIPWEDSHVLSLKSDVEKLVYQHLNSKDDSVLA